MAPEAKPKGLVNPLFILLGDVIIILGVYFLLLQVRFGKWIPAGNRSDTLLILGFASGLLLTLLALYNTYRDLHRPFLDVVAACILSVFISLVGAMSASYFLRAPAVPRSIVLGAVPLHIVLLIAWRLVFSRAAKRYYFSRPAIVVTGAGEQGSENVHLPEYINIRRIVSPRELLDNPGKEFTTGHHLVFVFPDVASADKTRLIQWAVEYDVDMYLIPTLSEILVASGKATQLGDTQTISLGSLGLSAEQQIGKRVIDILCSAVLLAVFSPLFILVPIANRLFSPGPTFYKQERVGLNGKRFYVYKFRSMIPDAEKQTGAVWAKSNDDRVTPVGKVLRATRLDEVPQFLNILKGEMSLVGPRPERPMFVEEFTKAEPNFALRTLVKPGLTGLAQVLGRYDTSPENKLRFDLMYIATYSLWLDIQIIIWTVQAVLFPQKWVDSPPRWLAWVEDYKFLHAEQAATSEDK